MRKVKLFVKWTILGVLGAIVVLIALGVGGYRLPVSDAEVTQREPFSKFIGREYLVKVPIEAMFWNDFPNKEKIVSVSIGPATAKTRFVSKIVPIGVGQRIRLVSAWQSFALLESNKYYRVSISDLEVPEGVPIHLDVNSDGIPDASIYEPIK
ncbi:hypothetical protein ACLVWU_08740 [Bdellovibrio sp. HCB290]|uniref:hypothetical protein n=1 Tax=Bdellovibrio sp. HCB290 TaxID=3394356 RepID=UPI0039B46CE5